MSVNHLASSSVGERWEKEDEFYHDHSRYHYHYRYHCSQPQGHPKLTRRDKEREKHLFTHSFTHSLSHTFSHSINSSIPTGATATNQVHLLRVHTNGHVGLFAVGGLWGRFSSFKESRTGRVNIVLGHVNMVSGVYACVCVMCWVRVCVCVRDVCACAMCWVCVCVCAMCVCVYVCA